MSIFNGKFASFVRIYYKDGKYRKGSTTALNIDHIVSVNKLQIEDKQLSEDLIGKTFYSVSTTIEHTSYAIKGYEEIEE
jgi:hypothetical protein